MAVDFFLKLSNSIDGESQDSKHANEISVLSFSWGASQTTSVAGTGGSGAGKASLADLSIMKNYDWSSSLLYKALLAGTHITTGVLTAIKSGTDGSPFITISLGELFVTSIQVSGSSEVPMESISFSYNTISTEYAKQGDDGSLSTQSAVNYDLKTNVIS